MTEPPTAEAFLATLHEKQDPAELPLLRKRLGPDDDALGIRMRDLFDAAKQASAMPLDEVDQLLASSLYEARMGAFCILDFRAKDRRCDPAERERLYTMYLASHDRITTWDMVDRAAPSVVGGHLLGRSPAVLLDLARSSDPLRRRTAVTAPLWFVRYGSDVDLATVPPLAEILAADPDPIVHLAVGTLLKHTGTRDPRRVGRFLQQHAASMPRAALRAGASKLPPDERAALLAAPG